jgi:tetratricopeptide (TPR) repeat protein
LTPLDIEAHEFIGNHYLSINKPEKAIEHFIRILNYKGNDPGFDLALANAYIQAERYADAEEILEASIENTAPDSLSDEIAARYGLALFYRDRIDESKRFLESYILRHRRSPEVACMLGQIESSLHAHSPQAASYFQQAVSIDPRYADGWYQLARYYMHTGNYAKSRDILLKVLEIRPLHAKAHARLGMAYYYLNQPESAKKAYLTALAINPNDYNTHYNLGELYYSFFDQPAKALSEFKEALGGNPAHSEAHFKAGIILLSNGMVKEAVSHLKKAHAQQPSNTRLALQLGVAYEKLNMFQKALSTYRSILDYEPLHQIARQKVTLLSNRIDG